MGDLLIQLEAQIKSKNEKIDHLQNLIDWQKRKENFALEEIVQLKSVIIILKEENKELKEKLGSQ